MVEPIISPVAAPTVTTPTAEAPAAGSPVVEASAAPSPTAPTTAPAAESAPVVQPVEAKTAEPAKADAAPEAPKLKNSLLDTDAKVEAKAPEQPKEEASQTEKAQLPTYEAFKLPEGMTYDQEKLSDFVRELGEFQTKHGLDQALMQEFGQKLMDKHVAELQKTLQSASELTKSQRETQVDEWDKAFRSDPEIGGKKQDTTLNAAKSAIATLAGNEAQQKEFRALLQETGAYAHPAMIRTLANMHNKIESMKAQIAKYTTEEGIKPLPATKPEPTNLKTWEKRYTTSKK